MADINGIEIFAAGVWNSDIYTVSDLDDMVRNFDRVGFQPPVKLGHAEQSGDRSFGWVRSLRRIGSKLVADLTSVPDALVRLIKERAYDAVSSEVFWDLERNGKRFRRVLKAVALLGAETPAISDLRPLHTALNTIHGHFRTYSYRPQEVAMNTHTSDPAEELQSLADSLVLSTGITPAAAMERVMQTTRGKELANASQEYRSRRVAEFQANALNLYARSHKASESLHAEAEHLMSRDRSLSYTQAVQRAMAENDDLVQDWNPAPRLLRQANTEHARRYATDAEAAAARLRRADGEIDRLAKQFLDESGSDDYQEAVAHILRTRPGLYRQYLAETGVGREAM